MKRPTLEKTYSMDEVKKNMTMVSESAEQLKDRELNLLFFVLSSSPFPATSPLLIPPKEAECLIKKKTKTTKTDKGWVREGRKKQRERLKKPRGENEAETEM